MRAADYLRDVLVPANVAVSAIQRDGLPIDVDRLRATRKSWLDEVAVLERQVEGRAAELGVPFKYSARHGAHPPKVAAFLVKHLIDVGRIDSPDDFVDPDGKRLVTPKGGQPSNSDALARWASLRVPRPDDDEYVTRVLQIRSLAKGAGTYLDAFERAVRSDGRCHPKYNWALRTSRLSAEDPPVHQIPERSEKRVPDGVKSCIIPRVKPALDRDAWDPRKHGGCFRWDIVGAEAAIRAAMLTWRAGRDHADLGGRVDPIAYDYIRLGKDIHSKTASIAYGVPDGTYKKGSYERDEVGKRVFFTKIFGARPSAVQWAIWDYARLWLDYDKVETLCANFDAGYSGLTALYEVDKRLLGQRMGPDGWSYCVDPYGRRRAIPVPPSCVQYWNRRTSTWNEAAIENRMRDIPRGSRVREELQSQRALLNRAFHLAANTPTQNCNASDTLWMLALCYLGEYVELRVPPMWERDGVPFPEARGWQMSGGAGPDGKPFQAWHCNTVHDSGWGDFAPGYAEPTAKLLWRRCTSLPLDWRLDADVPYRIELKMGPDMASMENYNKVAKKFGLEPMPER